MGRKLQRSNDWGKARQVRNGRVDAGDLPYCRGGGSRGTWHMIVRKGSRHLLLGRYHPTLRLPLTHPFRHYKRGEGEEYASLFSLAQTCFASFSHFSLASPRFARFHHQLLAFSSSLPSETSITGTTFEISGAESLKRGDGGKGSRR